MTVTRPHSPLVIATKPIARPHASIYPPGLRPTLDLRWGEGEALPGDFSTTGWVRGGTETKIVGRPGDGQLYTLGANLFATDHNFDGTPNGLVVEAEGTNLCLQSADLSNASWTKSNTTGVKDATGPDGVANSASTLTADANDGTCLQAITAGSAAYTYSVYVKRKTGTGTVEITDDGLTGSPDITASLSTTQWARFQITQTQANPDVGFRLGTSGDEIEVWGNQVEAEDFATSPVATTTIAVARGRETLVSTSMDWFNDGGPGTLLVKAKKPVGWDANDTTGQSIVALSNNVANDELVQLQSIADGRLDYIVRAGGSLVARIIGTANPAADTVFSIAAAWDTDDFAVSHNGGAIQTDTGGAIPTGIDRITIGNGLAAAGVFHQRGGIFQITYWPTRLPNDYLVTLAT